MITPAFVTPYTENGTFGIDRIPSKDEIFTIQPPFLSIINGSTAFVVLNVPRRFVLISPVHWSSVIKWNGVGSYIMPALLIKISTVSNDERVCSIAFNTPDSFVTSAVIGKTFLLLS